MSESNEEIRFYYKKSKNITQAAKKICDVYGSSAVSMRVAQIWFKRFQSGNFDVKDARRSGRPITDKIDAIFEKVEQDRPISSNDAAEELGIDHKTVLAYLKKTGYIKKLDIWKPGLTRNETMLCVWWHWKGIIHYELFCYHQAGPPILNYTANN
ncbi:hypothetical protein ABMA28_014470 [Loxostege sticticalis]|uniref:Mos1 transposase HTH domain-containing protein n=1 Tax=Loxostege sticticalis TaxID=481309 RepID=A0ABD0TGW9_LOXSC